MNITAGIDCGSRTIKIVLYDSSENSIIDYSITETGLFPDSIINEQLQALLIKNQLKSQDLLRIYSTGYGRNAISFNTTSKSEITCHAKGTHYFLPETKTIIDIGGQDSKVICINHKGKVLDFIMNDKCAAGTGRFLEKVALLLQCNLDEMNEKALNHSKSLSISSTCVVFAESEIIGLLTKGEKAEDIIYAVYKSIAHRIKSQTGTLNIKQPIAFVGGVAHHKTMAKLFMEYFNTIILSPEQPSITGAVGAAIMAAKEE